MHHCQAGIVLLSDLVVDLREKHRWSATATQRARLDKLRSAELASPSPSPSTSTQPPHATTSAGKFRPGSQASALSTKSQPAPASSRQSHAQARPATQPAPARTASPFLPPRGTLKSQSGTALGEYHEKKSKEVQDGLLLGQALHLKLKEMTKWGCPKCWGLPEGVKGAHGPEKCALLPGRQDAHWAWQRKSVGETTGPCWRCCLNKNDDNLHGLGHKCLFIAAAGSIGYLICSHPRIRQEFIAAFRDIDPDMDDAEKITAFMIERNPAERDWIQLATVVMDWWWRRGKEFGHGAGR